MIDRAALNTKRIDAEIDLKRRQGIYETGFKHISEIKPKDFVGMSFSPDPKPDPSAVIMVHRESGGFGDTAEEAIEDWQTRMKYHPQSGERLHWRVKPEIDYAIDFERQKPVWKVYARFSVA